MTFTLKFWYRESLTNLFLLLNFELCPVNAAELLDIFTIKNTNFNIYVSIHAFYLFAFPITSFSKFSSDNFCRLWLFTTPAKEKRRSTGPDEGSGVLNLVKIFFKIGYRLKLSRLVSSSSKYLRSSFLTGNTGTLCICTLSVKKRD